MTTRQAVILAGGLGTRIAALSGGLPKILLPVAGRPFLHHLLEHLAGQGITEVVLLLGVGADAVVAAARTDPLPGLLVATSVEPRPLGTGGALRLAANQLADRFFLVNGDTLLRADLPALERRHVAGGLPGAGTGSVVGALFERDPLPSASADTAATLALVRVTEAGQKGSVELNERGFITRFLEKGRSGPGLINGGVYLIEKDAVSDIPLHRPVSLEQEILPAWIDRGGRPALQGVVTDAYFVDIGLPEDYLGVINGFPDKK
ncbi:MAG: sugar phosphate nucleotidyltransferase [Candidatus Eisenbacteria bacterium]|nr:sugar phosphate nucleotidyltransferase [Candidatus Eisenbacteria bacterium]